MRQNNLYLSLNAIFLINLCQYSILQTNDEISTESLSKQYNSLKKILPFDAHGWYTNEKWITMLFNHNKITSAIEIGSWLGKSTRHIASLLPMSAKLYAVDTWKGSVEHQSKKRTDVYDKLPTLYEQFLSNIIHAKLTDKIIPIRMTSLEAASYLKSIKQQISLVYIDAAHDTQSVLQDVEAWYPYIAGRKGILCGDDWNWRDKKTNLYPIQEALHIFGQKYNLTIYAHENFWFIVENGQYETRSFLHAEESVWAIIE